MSFYKAHLTSLSDPTASASIFASYFAVLLRPFYFSYTIQFYCVLGKRRTDAALCQRNVETTAMNCSFVEGVTVQIKVKKNNVKM